MLLYLKRSLGWGLWLWFTCCVATTFAQQADSLETRELEGVQVIAGKKRFLAASVMPAQSLSGDALQRLNSFSVADAIRYFSGVQLKDYGGIGGLKTVNVRSMGTQHVGVFLDGISIGNAQNGTVDLGKFSLDNIEAITLYNGHNPDLLQPAKAFFASSGLYLQTAQPTFGPQQKRKLRASFKTGSFGLANPAILWQEALRKDLSLSANAEWITANGRYKYRYTNGVYDTTATRHNADITALRGEATLFKKFSSGTTFLKAYFYHSNRGLPGAIVAGKYYSPQRLEDRNFFVHGSYRNNYSKNYTQLIHLKYTSDYTRYLDPDYITTKGPLNNIYRQQELYASLAQKYTAQKWWEISVSTDFSFNTLDANLYRFAFPRRYSYIASFSNNFQWPGLSIQASLLYGYFDEQTKAFEVSADRKAVSPTIAVSWQPLADKGFRVRGFYKESLRLPTFNDLYYTLVGNTFLKPEYTQQWNAGFTWVYDSRLFADQLSIQADIYYNRVKDKIVAVPAANLFRWMMLNLGLVAITGAELNMGFTKKLTPALIWNGGFSYTWQKALNKTRGQSSYNQQIPYMPRHSGTAHGALSHKRITLHYSFIYTGARYALPENTARNYIAPWYTTDLGLNYENKARRWKLGIDLNNIFNQYYDVVLNFPMPGRNYRCAFTLNL